MGPRPARPPPPKRGTASCSQDLHIGVFATSEGHPTPPDAAPRDTERPFGFYEGAAMVYDPAPSRRRSPMAGMALRLFTETLRLGAASACAHPRGRLRLVRVPRAGAQRRHTAKLDAGVHGRAGGQRRHDHGATGRSRTGYSPSCRPRFWTRSSLRTGPRSTATTAAAAATRPPGTSTGTARSRSRRRTRLPGGAAAARAHGFPVQQRSVAEHRPSAACKVVGLRLPGHGAAVSGLPTFEIEMAAAVRLAMRDLRRQLGPDVPIWHGRLLERRAAVGGLHAPTSSRAPTPKRPGF